MLDYLINDQDRYMVQVSGIELPGASTNKAQTKRLQLWKMLKI